MIRSILVPLDGSRFAERALPAAEALARRTRAPLVLVRVHVPLPLEALPGWQATLDSDLVNAEASYLRRWAETLASHGVRAESVAVRGSVPFALRIAARSCAGAVIVMASHRRRPLDRVLYGSVADSLVRRSGCPVLLVGEPAAAAPTAFGRVVVPLSAAAGAEAVVRSAFEIAGPVNYVLVHVRSEKRDLRHAAGPGDDSDEPLVPDSLHRARTLLEGWGVTPEVRVLRGEPVADVIAGMVREGDLLAIAARHGRGRRLLFGSTADRLVRALPDRPVLLGRPQPRPTVSSTVALDGVARHGRPRSPGWRDASARKGGGTSGAWMGNGVP